jgi:hypothetical protein
MWKPSSTATAAAQRSSMNSDTDDSVGLDDPTALSTIAQEWIDRLDQFGNIYPVAKPRALLLHGQFDLLLGSGASTKRKRLALAAFRKSLSTARALSMPYDEALAMYELGKHADLTHHPQARQKNLHQAQELFEACGARYDVQRCRVQLTRAATGLAGGGTRAAGTAPMQTSTERLTLGTPLVLDEAARPGSGEEETYRYAEDDGMSDPSTARVSGASAPSSAAPAASPLVSISEAMGAPRTELRAIRLADATLPTHAAAPTASDLSNPPSISASPRLAPSSAPPADGGESGSKLPPPARPKIGIRAATSLAGGPAAAEGCGVGCGTEPRSGPASARYASDDRLPVGRPSAVSARADLHRTTAGGADESPRLISPRLADVADSSAPGGKRDLPVADLVA